MDGGEVKVILILINILNFCYIFSENDGIFQIEDTEEELGTSGSVSDDISKINLLIKTERSAGRVFLVSTWKGRVVASHIAEQK